VEYPTVLLQFAQAITVDEPVWQQAFVRSAPPPPAE
jgi:hypothetical protein